MEVFGDPHGVLVDPGVQLPVTHAVLQTGKRRGVRKLPFVLFFGQFLVDEAPFGVRTARILDGWVHVDRKRVPNAPNPQILVKTVVFTVLGQDAEVPFAKRDLVVASGVVGHVGVRDVLDMAHDAVEYLSDFHVGLVVSRNHLAARPVLALVVGDLQHMLRQLVDGQAGPRVDGLALDRAAGGQHVSRPLPLVVGRGRTKAQVVQLVLTGIRIGRDRHCQASTHGRQHVGVTHVALGAAACDGPCLVDACVLIGH